MSIYSYRLKLAYKGSKYFGWQIQPDALKTIQGQLNHTLMKISKSREVTSLGSGRTDSGVHALGQIVKIKIPLQIAPLKLLKALNSQLPADIRVLEAFECSEEFHPVRDALWKRYSYYFYVGEILPPSVEHSVTWERGKFNRAFFEAVLDEYIGTYDFINFSTKGTIVKSTIRTIYEANLTTVSDFFPHQACYEGQVYRATFVGNGFLKQMVRLLVGAAFMVSREKASPSEIASYLGEEVVLKPGPVASADGLYLEHVEYQTAWTSSN